MNTNDPVIKARERAKAKLGFYSHLATYMAVNSILILINFVSSTDYFWAIWPVLGWGIGVALHALTIFILPPSSKILDQLTEAEMRKEDTSHR